MRPIVMLPTYNEAENLRPIVEAVLAADERIHALVVDDESPDGTGAIAEEMARTNPRVSVLRRKDRRGRGYAGVEGMQWCLAQGFDPIIEMDADFSHDPARLPAFLAESDQWDVVIGSRHIEGGRETGRGWVRRFITWGAGVYLKTMLGVWRVQDPTSGYRCFRARALESIHLETLRSRGPSIVTEILFCCRKMRIREIPIHFRDREKGHSKFNIQAMRDSLWMALRMRLESLLGL